MSRLLLAVTVLSCVITPIALSADGPENIASAQSAPASAAPVYVKVISPVDPATPVVEDQPVIESWIAKSIDEEQRQANLRAVTAWTPLVENGDDDTELWDGEFGGVRRKCPIRADIIERKDGWIKITFQEWGAARIDTTVALKDEPGSREVASITLAKTKQGMPHIAIFIGLPVK